MAIRKYFWAGRNTPLLNYRHLSDTVIPVLEPADEARKAGWNSVLQWYGLEEISPPAQDPGDTIAAGYETCTAEEAGAANNPGSAAAPVKDIIMVIGPDLLEPVTVYSRITGRSLLKLKSVAGLEEDGAAFLIGAAESVLVAALPDCLTYEVLDRIACKLYALNPNIEWGVVTAPDPAGLSFVFAKLLADSSRPLKEGALDILHGYIYEAEPAAGDFTKNELDSTLIQEAVGADWRTLVIAAHGEGAHAYLESVVLCGITGRNELDASGAIIQGCRPGVCKRVHDPAVNIWPVCNLKNQISVFLSCNGFSVAKQLYPSDVSFILSAAEGFTSAVITTTKCLPFEEHVPVLFLRLIQSGMSLGAIVRFENNAELFSNSVAPYILFGDPLLNRAGSPTPRVRVGSSGEFHNERSKRLIYLDLKEWTPKPVIEVLTAGRDSNPVAVLGLSNAALLTEGPEIIANGRLIDRTGEFEKHTAWLTGLLRGMERIKLLEQAINHYHIKDFEANPELKASWSDICRVRADLTSQIYRMLRFFKLIKQNRLWKGRAVAAARRSIDESARLWESGFSIIVREKLLKNSLYHILHYYHFEKGRQKGPNCNRCGTASIQTAYCCPDGAIDERRAVECPVCGELYEYPENGPLIETILLHSARPGETAVFKIQCPDDAPAAPPGILVGQVNDKSMGNVFYKFHKQGRIEAGGVNIEIPLPADLGLDLHTIKIAWIRSLDVSYARYRFPVIKTNRSG
jgi:hypothetical protein